MKHEATFKGFKKAIKKRYGAKEGRRIWQKAENKYHLLKAQYPDVKGDGQFMYNVAAIYTAVKEYDPDNALELVCECGKQLGVKMRKLVHAFTSIPGVPKLLWKNMPKAMRDMSSEKNGYTRRIVNETSELVGVDILSCPIYDAAVKMGVPEAAKAICLMDLEYMTGFKNINYTRTTSVAYGDECCDYRLSYDKNKK